VILDLRRVSEIDSTGAQILLDIHAELTAHGQHLLLSLTQTSEAAAQLEESGVAEAVGEPHMFPDLDRALEWAEDELLRADGVQAEDQPELPLGGTSAAAGFTAAELALLEKEVERRTYPPRSTIFREGDAGDELFIVVAGSASAHIRQPDGRDSRLVSFAPGTVFGELAILDSRARSATVASDAGLACYVLATKGFAALSARSPAVALKLTANLGRELSHRLRAANRTIQQLEE
jgi:sulfate permease, SulP family